MWDGFSTRDGTGVSQWKLQILTIRPPGNFFPSLLREPVPRHLQLPKTLPSTPWTLPLDFQTSWVFALIILQDVAPKLRPLNSNLPLDTTQDITLFVAITSPKSWWCKLALGMYFFHQMTVPRLQGTWRLTLQGKRKGIKVLPKNDKSYKVSRNLYWQVFLMFTRKRMAQSLIFLFLTILLNQWFSSVTPGQQHQCHLKLTRKAACPSLPRRTESETEDEAQLFLVLQSLQVILIYTQVGEHWSRSFSFTIVSTELLLISINLFYCGV